MRIFLLILAALIVAGGTGFYLLDGLRPPVQTVAEVEAAPPPPPSEVYVPAVELGVGSIILPEHLGRMRIDSAAITAEMVMADDAGSTLLLGSVARQTLPKGVPIARSATVQPGDRGFLAAVLPQGKRAISIPISETAGLSGLVLPGDRVDIILTYSVSGDVIDAERDIRASETVIMNLRVLALDQRLRSEDADAGVAPPIAQTATLEVTPQQAEIVTLATTLGDLSLVLNSVRDGGDEAPAVAEVKAILAAAGDRARDTARDTGGRLTAIRPRNMTLDSDVTSLLRRQAPSAEQPAAITEAALPLSVRVQIVRGRASQAVEFGATAATLGAPAPIVADAAAGAPAPLVE